MRNPSDVLITRFAVELIVASMMIVVGLFVALGSQEFGTGWGNSGPQAGYFPFYIGLIIIIVGACIVIETLFGREKYMAQAFLTVRQAQLVFSFLAPILGFVVLSTFLGLYLALGLYLFGVMFIQGKYHWFKALLVSVMAIIAFYLIFDIWFQVPLLKGPIEQWLL